MILFWIKIIIACDLDTFLLRAAQEMDSSPNSPVDYDPWIGINFSNGQGIRTTLSAQKMEGPNSKLLLKDTEGKGATTPTELELATAKALYDIQTANSELAGELRLLQIRGAREVELNAGRKAIVILVPVSQLKGWRRIQPRILRELEKKLGAGGERSVVLVAFRRILPKLKRRVVSNRPRSNTLTAVHDAWLEDMVYPTEVVGKRTRVKIDGSRIIKILLDSKDQTILEGRTEAMTAVYRKLTGKQVVFEFPPAAVQDEEPRRK